MTLEQINALTKEDVLSELLMRLQIESDPEDGSVEAELEVYKQELRDALAEKERIQDWKTRFKAIPELREVFKRVGHDVPNAKAKAIDVIMNLKDEQILIDCEAMSVTVEQEKADAIADKQSKEDRKQQAQDYIDNLKWSDVTKVADVKAVIKELVILVKKN